MSKNFIKLTAAVFTAAVLASSCAANYSVKVSNSFSIDRQNETIEINLKDIPGISARSAVVLNADGVQVPCQTYTNAGGESLLIFQADVPADSEAVYTVTKGRREEFETKAYSRYVPERLDDYAYENNLVAGRIYGPALEDPRTYGSDIWVKCTDRLIIDEWYAKDDYHHNYGEGMDCYKVDNTLGGGAWAPFDRDLNLVIGDNYASYKHICDGPIRTEAVFEYDPILIGEQEVSATRVLSLDANSRFVKNVVTFHYEGPHIQVALAAINHGTENASWGDNWLALIEPASDSDDPARDGDIAVGLVYIPAEDAGADSGFVATDKLGNGHAGIAVINTESDTYTGWTGSKWTETGTMELTDWSLEVLKFALYAENPLQVTVK